MTALYMDSFDHYGVLPPFLAPNANYPALNNMSSAGWSFTTPYSSVFGIDTPAWGPARTGPYAFMRGRVTTGVYTQTVTRSFPTPLTNFFLSISIAVDALPTTDPAGVLYFRNSGGTELYRLNLMPNGSLQMYNSSTSTVIATTSGSVVVPQTWYFLEMQVNTAGNWVLRVDDATGTDTPALQGALAGGTPAIIGLGGTNTASTINMWFDDFFLRDTNGSVNNSWLGDRRIATMYPSADTADAGWTPEYYKFLSPGIATVSTILTGLSGVQNPTAIIKTNPATALNIGAQDFTLETFIRFDRLPENTENFTIFNKWNTTNATGRSYQLRFTNPSAGSFLEFRTSTDGTGATEAIKIQYPWFPNAGQWYHVALVRASGELLLFVDGVQLGLPIPDTDTYFASTTSALGIGGQNNGTNTAASAVAGTTVIGRLDETRFTNGVARYTSSFSPITTMFPRGAIADPDWASVVLLMGYDVSFTDESSFNRTIVADLATIQLPTDGDPPGAWTTVSKQTPDNNTYIRAPLTPATNILTMTTNPVAADTVTVGTTDGTTPAVYKFVSALVDPFDVLIGATAQDTLENLLEAINNGAGEGTTYGTGTTANADVMASSLPVGQFMVIALIAGTIGNSIAVASSSPAVWDDPSTLTGGVDIPPKSSFKLQRPPTNTTIISALQINSRAKKTDSGTGSIQAGLIGPLGNTANGPVHSLGTTTASYHDIIETDPDTSGPISPTTIVNGKITINRTA